MPFIQTVISEDDECTGRLMLRDWQLEGRSERNVGGRREHQNGLRLLLLRDRGLLRRAQGLAHGSADARHHLGQEHDRQCQEVHRVQHDRQRQHSHYHRVHHLFEQGYAVHICATAHY